MTILTHLFCPISHLLLSGVFDLDCHSDLKQPNFTDSRTKLLKMVSKAASLKMTKPTCW